ncbi:hypothetical protein H0H93_008316 [Arthromyces matolae]|nr:hypothetical protein H0H93_008316 [Arthromyces matolae]
MSNSSNQLPPSTTGSSATSWSRSGEPGSAFNGLSRGNRGRGTGRGRGGRGRGRGGPPRESKPTGADPINDVPNNISTSQRAATPSTNTATLPSATSEKTPSTSTTNPPSPARQRRNSRRTSRSISAVPATPVVTNSPNNGGASKSSNRRRRSQSGKTAPTLPKISVPSRDDSFTRSNRARLESVPHTAPIKDTPPHPLNGTNTKHTDVDTVHERVRAVASMEHRPHTPGSHIDWAGDDDDSLPDLDDWGITSTKVTLNEDGLISPLAVGGLKSLPGISLDIETHPKTPESTTGPISNQTVLTQQQEQTQHVINKPDAPCDVRVPESITTMQEPLISAPASVKVSLRPSLPADTAENVETVAPQEFKAPIPVVAAPGLDASIHAPNADTSNNEEEDPFSKFTARNGLAASIHAPPPGGITATQSAPGDISSYPRASPEYRTHNRSHTMGRPPSYANNNGRPSRSGYNSPRGGLSPGLGHHARTHSTPPTNNHNHRSSTQRPVISGDAITRLAKTIGNTTISSSRSPVSAHE